MPNILVDVPWNIHREDWQEFWWKIQGESQGPSPIFYHCQNAGHIIKLDNFSLVGKEPQGITRTIKEAMYIRVNDPPLNRNLGKYQLSHMWDGVLQDMPAQFTVTPYTSCTTNPLWANPQIINKGECKILPWGKYVHPRDASPSPLHPTVGTKFFLVVCPSQGCLSSPSLLRLSYILAPHFSQQNFWCQIGKYNIFSQTWRSTVSVDITKDCLDTCLIFCFAIWIS